MTERKLKRDEAKESLLRAATYLKWWRDHAIADAELPDDIGASSSCSSARVELSPDEAQPLEPPPR